jgi:TP901 family phage tail tape measure protein
VDKENIQATLSAKFGFSDKESAANGALAGKLYAENFGGSLEEVGSAAGLIQKLTGASGKNLEELTKSGLTVSKVFGYDVKESVAAANNIVANGLAKNSKEAFDLIATGAQMGLDVNNDLIDSLTEYSTQWNKLGVSGPTALGLMAQAQKAGVRNTDVLNDAFKEFSIRAIDGSKGTTAAFKELGLSTEAIPQALAKGGPGATKALDQVIKKIQAVKDPVKQSQLGVALFGTQFEDIGPKVFNTLDVVAAGTTKVGDATGAAADKLNSTTAAKFEVFKRKLEGFATDVGGSLLDSFNSLTTQVGPLMDNLKALWGGEGDAGPFANLSGLVENVKAAGAGISDAFKMITGAIMENKDSFATFFGFVTGATEILWAGVGPIFRALGAAIKAVIGILAGLIEFFAGVFTGDWQRAGEGIKKIWDSLWNGIKGILSNAGEAIKNIALAIWDKIKGTVTGFGSWISEKWSSIFNGIRNTLSSWGTSVKNTWNGFWDNVSNKANEKLNAIKNKITDFKNGATNAFKLARDGIGKAWGEVQELAKKPVNFIIDPVYKNLAMIWNKVANTVGLDKTLPDIKKFAKGGYVPGSGNRDTVPAMLTPGEGVLTKKEIALLGGPQGFKQFRRELQYYNDGGIVGGIKDWVGGKLKAGKDAISGILRGAIYPGAKKLADEFVVPSINGMDSKGFSGLAKRGASSLVNSVLSWFKTDDKKHAAPVGTTGMGYKKMMQVLNSRFPDLRLISGFRPGSKTLSGNTSYHASGRAVDVAPRRDVAQFINQNYKSLTRELITPFQDLNLHNGKKHTYTGAVWNQHNFAGGNAHVHWAMDNGGVLPPKSTTLVTNATSQAEYALTEDKLKNIAGPTNHFATGAIQISVRDDKDIEAIKEFFTGLPQVFASN